MAISLRFDQRGDDCLILNSSGNLVAALRRKNDEWLALRPRTGGIEDVNGQKMAVVGIGTWSTAIAVLMQNLLRG